MSQRCRFATSWVWLLILPLSFAWACDPAELAGRPGDVSDGVVSEDSSAGAATPTDPGASRQPSPVEVLSDRELEAVFGKSVLDESVLGESVLDESVLDESVLPAEPDPALREPATDRAQGDVLPASGPSATAASASVSDANPPDQPAVAFRGAADVPASPLDSVGDVAPIPWAEEVARASRRAQFPQWSIQPAANEDVRYRGDRPVDAVRLVYRVRFRVPKVFGRPPSGIKTPAGELVIDTSNDRLRARFSGPGWPVDPESEVRLRVDWPGAYLFDGRGGRPLGPGRLSGWYDGRPDGHIRAHVMLRREYNRTTEGMGDLVCALLAEWTHHDREHMLPRCRFNALPPGFRFGYWDAELTAVVPLVLPARALRADHHDPPDPREAVSGGVLLAEDELDQLRPSRKLGNAGDDKHSERAALDVHNRHAATLLVVVGGAPVGWVAAGERFRFEGFTPGSYVVGTVRPFGILGSKPALVEIPGELIP